MARKRQATLRRIPYTPRTTRSRASRPRPGASHESAVLKALREQIGALRATQRILAAQREHLRRMGAGPVREAAVAQRILTSKRRELALREEVYRTAKRGGRVGEARDALVAMRRLELEIRELAQAISRAPLEQRAAALRRAVEETSAHEALRRAQQAPLSEIERLMRQRIKLLYAEAEALRRLGRQATAERRLATAVNLERSLERMAARAEYVGLRERVERRIREIIGGDRRLGQRITLLGAAKAARQGAERNAGPALSPAGATALAPLAVAREATQRPRAVVRREGLGAERRIVIEFKLPEGRGNEVVEALVEEVCDRVADFLQTQFR